MRIQQLRLLLAIAETGSLRASARALNLTQPALTKALRLLEDELGAPLVVRSPHGARLAPAGELLAPGALARLGARWPRVQVRLLDTLYPRSVALVRAGEVDFAIGPVPADRLDTDLASRALFSSRSVIGVRRGHPLARARSLAALADAEWVLTGPAGGPGDPAALGFEALGLAPPRVRLACESFSTVLAMVGAGDVVCVMPERFVERHAARLELVQVPVADSLPDSPILAVWRTDVPLTLPARRLLDAFGQEARGLG